jgi:hypothetical protein
MPSTKSLTLAMSAKLLAMALTSTRWPGSAAKLGVSSMRTVGGGSSRLARSTMFWRATTRPSSASSVTMYCPPGPGRASS